MNGITRDIWPEINEFNSRIWEEEIDKLRLSMENLLKILPDFEERKFDELIPGKNYTYYTAILGLIQHNIYHAGQIALLKKALLST